MKKYILALLICICVSGVSFAEIVKGVVMEPNGEPAIGATVLEKGKPSNGTSTNIDGEFSLNVASLKSSSLEVSYIGMENKVVKIDGKNNLLIELKYAGGFALDEVVIVGYGTQKKINATGAVKTIDNAVLESRPLSNAVQGLQGAVAGLNITNDAGGGLGQKMNINIRGMGSIGDGSDASPLVLIDGMEGDLSN
ncbi:MAG: carboxypeptidase-like regulatory domain-containing protein, partial [Paramuribaculum sp.]|nr:carboxypeptidase-like regulatory domain-containing protein [Paramuribaculum sp.]